MVRYEIRDLTVVILDMYVCKVNTVRMEIAENMERDGQKNLRQFLPPPRTSTVQDTMRLVGRRTGLGEGLDVSSKTGWGYVFKAETYACFE